MQMNVLNLAQLLSTIVGAVVGSTYAGSAGAVVGAFIAWLIPHITIRLTANYRRKGKILNSLSLTDTKEVRDVMMADGVLVPTDCFKYDDNHPFVVELAKYKKAFSELEMENRVVHNKHTSVCHGYVDSPNDWVNDWSGRAYQKSPKQHQ